MPDVTEIVPFAVALLIGLIVGIERERSSPVDAESAGVRTFMLIGLLGALAAKIQQSQIVLIIGAFIVLIIIAGYFRTTKIAPASGLGFTTEVSAMCTFGLGFLTATDRALSLLLGIVLFAILYSRTWLHRFAREILQPGEIRAVLILAILMVGILPLLPAEAIDPWGLVHLRNLLLVIAALVAIQFASHVAIRAFGDRLGILTTGFLGGFVSSTSVFVSLPSKLKERPELISWLYAAGLLAAIATFVELLIVLALIDVELLRYFALPIAAMILTGFAFVFKFGRGAPPELNRAGPAVFSPEARATNPIDLKSVFKLAAFFSILLLVVSISNKWLGSTAASATVFLGALVELQGVVYSTAELVSHGDLAKSDAVINIGLAISASVLSKVLILLFLNRGRFAVVMSAILSLMLALGAAVLLFCLKVIR